MSLINEALERARTLSPGDKTVPLYLGLAYEGARQWGDAIRAYRSYPRAEGSAPASVT